MAPAGRLGNTVVSSVAVSCTELPLLGTTGRENFGGSTSGLFHSQGQFPRGDVSLVLRRNRSQPSGEEGRGSVGRGGFAGKWTNVCHAAGG